MKKALFTFLILTGATCTAESLTSTMPTAYKDPVAFGENSTTITLSAGTADLYNWESTNRAHRNNWMLEFQLTDINLVSGTHVFFKANGSAGGLELYINANDTTNALTVGFSDYSGSTLIGDAIALEEGITYRASFQYADGKIQATYITNTVTGEFSESTTTMGSYAVLGEHSAAQFISNEKVTISLGDAYNCYHLNVPDTSVGQSLETIKATFRGYATLATNMVPEPTTATLSLLALAGLAARRRRASH